MISLRPIEPHQKAQLFHWRNEETIYKWCRQNDLLDWSNHSNWFEKLGQDKTIKMYSIVVTGVGCIGICGLTDIDLINQRAEFSLYIAPEYQKKGYGKRALLKLLDHGFNSYPLHQIWGETFENNPASKVFERIGMKLQGIREDHYFRDGVFIDSILYSIKRKDFYDRNFTVPDIS